MKVAVYCSSNEVKNKNILIKTRALLKIFADNDIDIVYGGSNCGLMGFVADTALEYGAKVTGVTVQIPRITAVQHNGLTAQIFAADMPERRNKMYTLSDAFITLPGGPGTLDEVSEVICYSTLELDNKPVIIFNIDGYYDYLKKQFEVMIEENMCNPAHLKDVYFVNNEDEIIEILKKYSIIKN